MQDGYIGKSWPQHELKNMIVYVNDRSKTYCVRTEHELKNIIVYVHDKSKTYCVRTENVIVYVHDKIEIFVLLFMWLHAK